MSNHSIELIIDERIKSEATKVLAAAGLSVSEVIRLYITQVAEEKTIAFDPLIPNLETIDAMNDAREGRVKSCDTVERLFEDLNAPD